MFSTTAVCGPSWRCRAAAAVAVVERETRLTPEKIRHCFMDVSIAGTPAGTWGLRGWWAQWAQPVALTSRTDAALRVVFFCCIDHSGRMVFALRWDAAPKTCENFRSLCVGDNPKALSFK